MSTFTHRAARNRRLAVGASTATLALGLLLAFLRRAGPAVLLVPEGHESDRPAGPRRWSPPILAAAGRALAAAAGVVAWRREELRGVATTRGSRR